MYYVAAAQWVVLWGTSTWPRHKRWGLKISPAAWTLCAKLIEAGVGAPTARAAWLPLTCNKTQQLQSQKDTKTERSHMRLECRRQLCRSYFYVIKRSTCIISAYLQEQVVILVLALVSQHFEGTAFSSLKSESCSSVQVFLTISTLQ